MLRSFFCIKQKRSIPYGSSVFVMVGLVGLEPMTSTMSSAFPAVRRLTGNPYKSTFCACLLVWKGENKDVKTSGFRRRIPPDLHTKIRLKARTIWNFSGNYFHYSQYADDHQSTFNHLWFNFEERANTLSVNIHTSLTHLWHNFDTQQKAEWKITPLNFFEKIYQKNNLVR